MKQLQPQPLHLFFNDRKSAPLLCCPDLDCSINSTRLIADQLKLGPAIVTTGGADLL
jgi:hypothetical protein